MKGREGQVSREVLAVATVGVLVRFLFDDEGFEFRFEQVVAGGGRRRPQRSAVVGLLGRQRWVAAAGRLQQMLTGRV